MSLDVDDIAHQLIDKTDGVSYGKLIHFPFSENPFKRLFDCAVNNTLFGEEFRLIYLTGPEIGLALWKNPELASGFKRLAVPPTDSCIGHVGGVEVHVSLSKWLVDKKIYAVGLLGDTVTRAAAITMDYCA